MNQAPSQEKAPARASNTAPGKNQKPPQATDSNDRLQQEKLLCYSDRFRPQAEEAARQIIRSQCDYGPQVGNICDPATLPGTLAEIAGIVLQAVNQGAGGFTGIYPYFINSPPGLRAEFVECNQGNSPLPQDCKPLLEIIRDWHLAHQRDLLAHKLRAALERVDDPAPLLAEFAKLESDIHHGGQASLTETLAARAFNFESPPEKPIPLFRLCDMSLSTAGNLTNVQALPKAGKSAVVESMIAAVMNGNRQGPDTLGFSAENPQGHALVHFDTEQSRYDADALIRRACRRAHAEKPPEWFLSYSVADMDIRGRRHALRHVMAEARETHGGIFAVMIDGIGDLCADPNDSEESFDLVHELHALAIKHHCTIATVLHENPGSESGKTRGHLGSQLERKAETNLRLAKDKDGITTIWAERARHCYLPKEQGPCFAWNDSAGMHTSCGTSGEIKSAANRERAQTEAETAFGGNDALSYTELVKAIVEALEVSERTAKARIKYWLVEGITRKNATGNHHLTNP